MSRKYLRIYVNGKKVRSTGCHRWYRDLILKEFGYEMYEEGKFRKIEEYPDIKTVVSNIPNSTISLGPIKITIEYVKHTKHGKHILYVLNHIHPLYAFKVNNRKYIQYDDAMEIWKSLG